MSNTWTSFNNLPPLSGGFNPDTMLLLTDGSVLVHNAYGKEWFRLTPDSQGKYESGTWSAAINMTNTRQFFASGVLKDGRVFALGGEYSDAGGNTPLGEIFDPLTNTWSPMNKPTAFNWIMGDASGCILPDGRVLLGALQSSRTALWDPSDDSWMEAGLAFGASLNPTKVGTIDEETWTLLPDGTVLAVQISGSPAAEKYIPSSDQWVSAGSTPANLTLSSITDSSNKKVVNVSEIGPAAVLPDGRLFAIGGTGHTALYTAPANPSLAGVWSAGPDFPADTSSNKYNNANGNIMTVIDGPACLLPNGKVLCVAGQTVKESCNGNPCFWSNPSTCFIYDPASNSLSQLNPQPPSNNQDTWTARFLLLPTGQVLFTSQQNMIAMLTLDPAEGSPSAAWKPVITSAPITMMVGHTYVISGTQINGLSQACSYGDDAQVATNYPIVRLTNTSNNTVVYLRSFGFSTLGIASGNTPQTTNVQVPAGVVPGQYDLVVIANGIASDPVVVQVIAQDCFFIVDRSTYGQGEIQALINLNGAPAVIDPALFVVVEGFTPSDLGLTLSNLSNPPKKPAIPDPVSKVSLEFSGAVIPENPSLPATPQRFTFPFRIVFQDTSMFNFAPDIEPVTLTASLKAVGVTVTSSAVIQLIKNPNPFILHGDTNHGYPWYLSVDVRVFQMKAGQTKFGAHVASSGAAKDVATNFIQQAINNLNGSPGSAGALFDALPQDEATSLALAPTDVHGVPVYNFALARVRYRDIIPANNVRLFFRMWPAQQTNATYDTQTLYRSASNAGGQKIPLLGVQGDEIITIPFFASRRIDTTNASMTTQTDAPNVRATINPDAIGGEVDSYFGCWLDINQPNDLIFPSRLVGSNPANIPDGPFTGMGTLLSIQQLVRSEHQCLIAEVSFDPDPIPTNADPSTSDKLAQRNLTFVNVPNPGLIESRRAPQTFEVRPTPYFQSPELKPDELMIEWGNTPVDSMVDIYLPAADADEILNLAAQSYSSHRLTKIDAHTLQCPTGGVTYIPIPRGQGANFAGLLTIDLPPVVKKGQVYNIIVRQVTSTLSRSRVVELGTNGNGLKNARGKKVSASVDVAAARRSYDMQWRRVLGVFQLTIPVSTKHELLAPEERLLSVLRWIGQSIPVGSRWYLVFQRYVQQIASRVRDMGGDPDLVIPDANGDWQTKVDGDHSHEHEHEHEREREHEERGEEQLAFSGKVTGLIYDRFGDFNGFLLDTEDGERSFKSREHEFEALVARAWSERNTVTVYAERHDPDRPLLVVLRGAVTPYEG